MLFCGIGISPPNRLQRYNNYEKNETLGTKKFLKKSFYIDTDWTG